MRRWDAHWNLYPKRYEQTEFLRQVKHTVNGEPIPESKLEALTNSTCCRLELGSADSLLDLCCGNGLITERLAKKCKDVVGVDFSQTLIDTANHAHSQKNISYLKLDALNLSDSNDLSNRQFDKILLAGGLQYFEPKELHFIILGIKSVPSGAGVVLVAGILDRKRRVSFYNTLRRRVQHILERVTDRDQMCTWWDKEVIAGVFQNYNLDCLFLRRWSAYRFDAIIEHKTFVATSE